MAHKPDDLLSRLIKDVDETGAFLPITIIVNGLLITGEVAPRKAWLKHNAEQLETPTMNRFARAFEREHDHVAPEEQHIHMSGAKAIYGQTMLPNSGGAFRVPVSEVSGWTLGEMRTVEGGMHK
ncbi:hypothetical protein ABZ609_00385 [Streptomyces rubiginosohelvolus]|uniref:hypothetical protein n=1 Tax=Streptomyces rubiginosohelvolus TaxID=67362 RepID=UPI0034052005